MNFGIVAPFPEIAATLEMIFYGGIVVLAFMAGWVAGGCK